MSKKDKSKFKRRLKAEILQEMTKSHQASQPLTAETFFQPSSSINVKPPEPKAEIIPNTNVDLNVKVSDNTLQFVRYDLKKSAIIIGSIIILIIALYFIDQKTGILLRAGDQLFKVFNINA